MAGRWGYKQRASTPQQLLTWSVWVTRLFVGAQQLEQDGFYQPLVVEDLIWDCGPQVKKACRGVVSLGGGGDSIGT